MKPQNNSPKAILATLSTLALVAAPFASAALVNVNFHHATGGPQTESALDGPLGGLSSTWNQSSATSGTDVFDSTNVATTIDWTINTSLQENDTQDWADPERVMQIGSFAQFGRGDSGDSTLTISGLVVGALYNVAIPSTRLRTGGTEASHGTFSTSNNTTSSSQTVDATSINGDAWVSGTNYALFENVEADGSGEISILADASNGAVVGEAGDGRRLHLNGFQIESVPEPSTTALLGLGGLALILRRRK